MSQQPYQPVSDPLPAKYHFMLGKMLDRSAVTVSVRQVCHPCRVTKGGAHLSVEATTSGPIIERLEHHLKIEEYRSSAAGQRIASARHFLSYLQEHHVGRRCRGTSSRAGVLGTQ